MSQFTTMIPIQGGSALAKVSADASSEGSLNPTEGDADSLSFSRMLQTLSESNPNVAALLLALQQAGFDPELTASLQTGGRSLPLDGETRGNNLPLPQLQALQEGDPQSLSPDDLQALDFRQLLNTPSRLPADAQRLAAALASLSAERPQSLDLARVDDLGSQLHGLGMTGHTPLASATARPAIVLPLQVPVGQPGWRNALGERIQWMVGHNVQQAEIKLSPPELGPMEIKISLHNDQTSVNFVAAHAATRDALEAAIPRLREMFGGINLNLANVDVSQQQSGGSRESGGGSSSSGTERYHGDEIPGISPGTAPALVRLQSQGVVDTYA